MTPVLVALIAVLPVALAGLALLFISKGSAPTGGTRSPHHPLRVK